MRNVPSYIEAAVKEKDPLVKISWDQSIHRWVLWWDGQRICTLFHTDGTDMMELVSDEIIEILDRFDNYKNGPERFSRMRAVAENARRKSEELEKIRMEESIRESEKVSRNISSGCPLQVYVSNNKLGSDKNA